MTSYVSSDEHLRAVGYRRRLVALGIALALVVVTVLTSGAAAVAGSTLTAGPIADKYASLGGGNSVLGVPTGSQFATADGGLGQHFASGSIYWSSATGAHEVHGAIRQLWQQLGWERGLLGYPLTDESAAGRDDGRFNQFQGGSIYWSSATGAHEVHGAIRDFWVASGRETGPLGLPTSNEYDVPGGRQSDFQNGSLTWLSATGTITKRLLTAPALSATVDDTVMGTSSNQFEYRGTWKTGTGPYAYGGSDHYTEVAGNAYTLRFNGAQVKIFGSRAPHHGIVSFAVDGGKPMLVDLYASTRQDQVALFDTGSLPTGIHAVVATLTSAPNPASSGNVQSVDYAQVFTTGVGPTPTPTPT